MIKHKAAVVRVEDEIYSLYSEYTYIDVDREGKRAWGGPGGGAGGVRTGFFVRSVALHSPRPPGLGQPVQAWLAAKL